MSLNESTVEEAAFEWFGELGYAVGHGPHIAPGEYAGGTLTPALSQGEKEEDGEVVLFGHKDFEDMDRNDRIRATYQLCCLRYVMNDKMTNQSLRERFRLSEKKTESVSRAIRDAVDAGKVKLADPEQTSLRYLNYVPFWA